MSSYLHAKWLRPDLRRGSSTVQNGGRTPAEVVDLHPTRRPGHYYWIQHAKFRHALPTEEGRGLGQVREKTRDLLRTRKDRRFSRSHAGDLHPERADGETGKRRHDGRRAGHVRPTTVCGGVLPSVFASTASPARHRRDATHTTSQRIARTKSATRAGTCSATTSSRPTPSTPSVRNS